MSADTARGRETATTTADTGWFDDLEGHWTEDGWGSPSWDADHWNGLDASTAEWQARRHGTTVQESGTTPDWSAPHLGR